MSKGLKLLKVSPFDVVTRSERRRAIEDAFHESEQESTELHYKDKADLFYAFTWRNVSELKDSPKHIYSLRAPGASKQIGTAVSTYIASQLALFVQTTASESPRLLALEDRLNRLERAVRDAGILRVDEAPRIDWNRLEAALHIVGETFAWKVDWQVDRENTLVVGRVTGVDHLKLSAQTLDFYERLASSVDKETFKALAFELQPAD